MQIDEFVHHRYRYVGPNEIADAVKDVAPGTLLRSKSDVLAWVRQFRADFDRLGCLIQTFVVTEDGSLCVADRHSEHVACAGGAPVLAAGEITFHLSGASVEVEAVTNQSTGYCPEPESWHAIANALAQAAIAEPGGYTTTFVFRRCEHCGQINLIKDEIFQCAVCDHGLPSTWNCDTDPA